MNGWRKIPISLKMACSGEQTAQSCAIACQRQPRFGIIQDVGTELTSHLADPVVDFVTGLLPSVIVEEDAKQQPGVSGQSYHIELPPPAGADYCFILWLGSGEKQISARLLNADKPSYFWYRPFEDAEFRSAEQLDKAFLEAVEVIIRHNTRIEQTRGLFFNHFKCEYESESGWKRLYGMAALRWIRAPKILGRKHIYQSPRLVRDI